ncbi:MAG: hypothetical protein KGS72_02975 [Cyanobacteria bacterium REEB67]|nr:hypothetical protein [Cyanobacteria bacterium REEB67]
MFAQLTKFFTRRENRFFGMLYGSFALSAALMQYAPTHEASKEMIVRTPDKTEELRPIKLLNTSKILTPISLIPALQTKAYGQPKQAMIKLVGPPDYIEKNLSFENCPDAFKNADEVWFYKSRSGHYVPATFSKGKCTGTPDLSGQDLKAYEAWKADQIEKRAPGMSEKELKAWLGDCFKPCARNLESIVQDLDSRYVTHNRNTGEFYLNSCTVVVLAMKSERCVKVEKHSLF